MTGAGGPTGRDPAALAARELVEEVDEAGRVVRVVTRAEMRTGRLRHRCVFVAVVGGDGQLLVHRRADWKDVAPGWWDVAFGGVVAPDEGWVDAARRELAEEAGIRVERLEPLGGGRYDDDLLREVAEVFLARSDGPFAPADGEVAELAWVSPEDLDSWLSDRRVCLDSLAVVVPRLRSVLGRPA